MDDTICAISTSLNAGAISIIRISGPDSINIINRIFSSVITKEDDKKIKYGKIIYNNEIIDEVLVSTMFAPKSYTVEDVVEINCHGGIATTKKILNIIIENGARLAEPGEFTKRAFLNGRIDLTQSEAINDLLKAQTEKERKLAINSVNGLLHDSISKIRKDLGDLLSNIEVNIDYPEYEDNLIITEEIIEENISKDIELLTKLLENSASTKIVKNGINVALVGSPNVGKSSLLNAFLDEEKAIVTSIAGTTRDIIEGKCTIEDVIINFIDTAGIRNTNDPVEKIGVEKSKEAISTSDLIIYVLDSSKELQAEEKELLEQLTNKNVIVFLNKNDLDQKIEINTKFPVVKGNTKTTDGIEELKRTISKLFNLDKIEINENSITSNIRQENLIKQSIEKLNNVLLNNYKIPIDMQTIDLKKAFDLLGEITGESYKDDLIDILFQNFCLGK